MATANPATAGQEPGAAPAAPANQHIDTLQSMLNLIFLHSGRFLKESQAGGGSGRMKQQLQRVVPHATERFHDALDELENEVRLAQTVLRRDMALLKQDRKKKEAAAAAAKQHEVEKARLAAESRNAPAAGAEDAPIEEDKAATPAPPGPPAAAQDAPEPPPNGKEPEPESESVKKEGDDAKSPPPPLPLPPPPPPPIATNVEPPKDALSDATRTTANPHEPDFDFDAMFGDSMDTSGDNNPHNDMMDTSGDTDFNLHHGNDGQALLRGLEEFAKDSENDNANQTSNMDMDFAMPDLPGLDMNTNDKSNPNADNNAAAAEKPAPEPETTPAPKAEEPKSATQPPPEESKQETTNNDDMTGTMATDDLEDLFNMDEYENPEQSSFDDAFLNFE